MMDASAIQAIGSIGVDPLAARMDMAASSTAPGGVAPTPSFAKLLADGVDQVNRKLADADAMVLAYAADDSVPLHQVTYALEEARLSLELALQVRARLVEAYQDISKMQL